MVKVIVVSAILFYCDPAVAQEKTTSGVLAALIELWTWEQYWEGQTIIGPEHAPGREIAGIIFWNRLPAEPGIGMCSVDIGKCVFYPDALSAGSKFESVIHPNESMDSALNKLITTSLVKFTSESSLRLGQPRHMQAVAQDPLDFVRRTIRFKVPVLGKPRSIRERRSHPRSVIDALRANLGCDPHARLECKLHLLIPFFSAADPYVPVFRECAGCGEGRASI